MQSSTLCAIIPTYNRASMLKECLDSILALPVAFKEIIVVNDGSTDNTGEVVKSYDDRITYIQKENGGKSSALNAALAQCSSDYVWICDDDDLAAPGDGLASLKAALDADNSLDFVYGKTLFFEDKGGKRELSDKEYYKFEDEPSIKIRFFETMYVLLGAMLVRRSAYQKAGPFREDLIRSQDYDMALRLSRHAKSLYVPEVIFLFRHHNGLRGSAADRFPAEIKESKWLEYDKKIFARIRNEYALEEFIPTFALQWEGALAHRAALLERMLIFAARDMWDESILDFRTIMCLNATPVTPQELVLSERLSIYIMERSLLSRDYGMVKWLRLFYRANAYGQSIIYAACRPLMWQARQCLTKGDIRGAMARLNVLVRIMGFSASVRRIRESLVN